ncbi:myelin-oligodendrocyte glycoprotein-like isoform X1 [Takifugu flavidus]|uniref:myelin-oligodendrocyte glycoprotein-like isoform X1 n=1 Tax=Takifugu flavidus TaxID=433684 RepID=UPI0025447A28|nr:myelin-oligodendrocyte glycoprotein-like isoform X1 [Takifugu flavidus]
MVISRIPLLFSLVAASLVALSRTVPTNDGQPHVVGSPQPIVAASGDSVVLPCHLEPSINVEETVVEWTRQDPSHVTFVHVYRDHVEVMDMKTASYRGRTALFIEELKHGNISLRITEVTEADEGSYRCFIPTLRSPVKDSTVRLVIKPNLRTATEFPGIPPTVDREKASTEAAETAPGRSRLAALVPFVLVVAISVTAAGYFLKFPLPRTCELMEELQQNSRKFSLILTGHRVLKVQCSHTTWK